MKAAFYLDANGVRHDIQLPDDAVDITQSFTLSQTVEVLKEQHAEQCKQNKRLYGISIATTVIAVASLLVSIVTMLISMSV